MHSCWHSVTSGTRSIKAGRYRALKQDEVREHTVRHARTGGVWGHHISCLEHPGMRAATRYRYSFVWISRYGAPACSVCCGGMPCAENASKPMKDTYNNNKQSNKHTECCVRTPTSSGIVGETMRRYKKVPARVLWAGRGVHVYGSVLLWECAAQHVQAWMQSSWTGGVHCVRVGPVA